MLKPGTFVLTLLLAIFSVAAPIPASSSATPSLGYTTSTPCEPQLGELLGELYAQNRNVYEQCQLETPDRYMLLPFSGFLPSDAQLSAMASSKSCLYFYRAVLLLPGMTECVLGGIGVKSVAETLLMTSQDLLQSFAVLTSREFVAFLTWRHERNVAQQSQKKFDARSRSAKEFDAQLRKALTRFELTIMESLRIQLKGAVIGVRASGSGGDTSRTTTGSEVTASTDPSTKDEIVRQFQLSSDSTTATSAATGKRHSASRSSSELSLVVPVVLTIAALGLSL